MMTAMTAMTAMRPVKTVGLGIRHGVVRRGLPIGPAIGPLCSIHPLRYVSKLRDKYENIYTLPNALTLSRLLCTPAIGYYILHDQYAPAVALLGYAGLTDLVDGWLARRFGMQSVVGTILDPLADKALMTVLTVCLAAKGMLPYWLAGLILGRDAALAVAAVYYRYISLPAPKTFQRYWDFSLPSAEVHPTTISKVNTALQLVLIGVTTAAPLLPVDIAHALHMYQYLVAGTTVWSGASYIYSKDAVRILSDKRD